ncbi:sialate O-acetylesterase [Cellulophaga baltica]|uniref:sialate O-acetylesterase n=1 Tax=Cellulophaga baltica TaxID=76594 RepID=UPI0024940B88|nr:sialate O-acetylesterase [Cellulophaga baltica]
MIHLTTTLQRITFFLGLIFVTHFSFSANKINDLKIQTTTPGDSTKVTPEIDANFHIYLCFGQSNMEGSATIESQDTISNTRFQMLQSLDCPNLNRTKGSWYTAAAPLTQCYTGLSPADYFGKHMIKNLPDSITIAVINVAVGGSDIRLFNKKKYQKFTDTYPEDWFQNKIIDYGGNPYQHLIDLAKKSQKRGIIKGILLHQGETNNGDTKWPTYVKKIYRNMLKDLSLKANQVPLLAGEVVHKDQNGLLAEMNTIIQTLPKSIPTSHVISSRGCGAKSDRTHFNSEGIRELGKRYAIKMLSLQYNLVPAQN